MDKDEIILKLIKESFDKLEERLKSIEKKVDTLWDTKNKQEGAVMVSRMIIGLVSGGIVGAVDIGLRVTGH